MIEDHTRTRPDTQVVCTQLDGGEAVLLHLTTKACYTLNATGALIWRLLDEGLSVGEVTDRITREFDVARPDARQGVLDLVRELAETGLAALHDGSGGATG